MFVGIETKISIEKICPMKEQEKKKIIKIEQSEEDFCG